MITNTNALILPKDQWKRINKTLTKKDDNRAALEEIKRLNDERMAKSKAIAETWNNPNNNERGRAMEEKKKLLADIEAAHLKRDEERRLEILERRNMIIEKARLNKWSEKDSTKTLSRRVKMIEVYKERDLQMEFNKKERESNTEKERLLHAEQNLDAERYKKERWEQKLQDAKTKKDKSAILLKQLKEREVQRHDEDIKLKEDGKRELEKIAREIYEEKEKEKAKNQAVKESMLINLADNREIIVNKNKINQLKEQEEDAVFKIIADSKKEMAATRKFRENELLKEKKLAEKKAEISVKKQQEQLNIKNLAMQKAMDEIEAKYQTKQSQKEELAKQMKKDLKDFKKAYDEETLNEKKQLELSRKWELERWQRESKVLDDHKKLEKQAKINKMNDFRKNLDIQSENNRIANMADKQAMLKYRDDLIKLLKREDDEFMSYAKSLIDKYEKAGLSVIPIFQAMKGTFGVNLSDVLEFVKESVFDEEQPFNLRLCNRKMFSPEDEHMTLIELSLAPSSILLFTNDPPISDQDYNSSLHLIVEMESKNMTDESQNDAYNSDGNPPISTDMDISMAFKKIALKHPIRYTELCDVVNKTFEDINDSISFEEFKTTLKDLSFLKNRKNATNLLNALKTQLNYLMNYHFQEIIKEENVYELFTEKNELDEEEANKYLVDNDSLELIGLEESLSKLDVEINELEKNNEILFNQGIFNKQRINKLEERISKLINESETKYKDCEQQTAVIQKEFSNMCSKISNFFYEE
ncbi:Hypothetical protein CINCED_3A011903 [Cinara cedri]|uniref:Trichohyalin-plectin-homology domain-containing protein n=1 Tax=Cinara cedri TaxID=506608 RepID=A0A5E4MZM9_9HEMI|nr:Hypothetical protein CINCED_3A011903 [Cinara cedri]